MEAQFAAALAPVAVTWAFEGDVKVRCDAYGGGVREKDARPIWGFPPRLRALVPTTAQQTEEHQK